MNLNILLWVGGMLFTLGIFAIKVGLGLRYGRVGTGWTAAALAVYVFLFVVTAVLSSTLVGMLEPFLRKGPSLHILMALGLIVWGVITVRGLHKTDQHAAGNRGGLILSSVLLIVPCPVCITAMTFSTWTALTVIKLHPALVGLGLGLVFAVMTLAVLALTSFQRVEHPETALGLAMMTIGLYFIASLFLPAKIEEARGVYVSFVDGGGGAAPPETPGVLLVLMAALLIGCFAHVKKEAQK